MAPDREQRYDPLPPIPTYDEAVAADSSRSAFEADPHSPLFDQDEHHDARRSEAQSLLSPESGSVRNGASSAATSRRAHGAYRAPTADTDDEDASLWSSDSEGDAAHVRREMMDMDVMDPEGGRAHNLSAMLAKRIGLRLSSLSLSRWKWTWRPRLPRWQIRLGESSTAPPGGNSSEESPRRRYCSKLSARSLFLVAGQLVAIFLVLGLLYLVFLSGVFNNMTRRLGGQMFDPESVRIHVQASVDPSRMRDHVEHFTSYAHIAGTEGDYALAVNTERNFLEYGLEGVAVDEYYVYLNYPKEGGRAVEILGVDGKPTWSATIEEEDVGGETAGRQTLVFHGHSKSGDVSGPLIYANYGSREDFKKLFDSGIDTGGAIALVRYYGSQEDGSLKVKAAEMAGFAGCIIYSDPADDGFLHGDVAPNGRYMPKDGVQRGSVALSSWIVGDVLTPGWASKKNLPRVAPSESTGLVQIPSIPLAWRDAQVLLQHLQGHGQRVSDDWVGGVPDVGEWWTGGPSGPVVHLKNDQDEVEQQPIWNVYGEVAGMEQGDKAIIIGCHRDAWNPGATDPHSGSAVLMEMARIFGDLIARGWRPLRTIKFMSWDAAEYNMVGSTEYVENNLKSLRRDAYAYINLDTVVAGDRFQASGSPVFQRALTMVLKRVGDPNLNASLYDMWEQRGDKLQGLGAGSDYVAFQDIAGTSSLDLRFEGDRYPRHSSYDNFAWVDRVADPGFVYHALMGQVVGLLILELAERPILPFDMPAYAIGLGAWIDDLAAWSAVYSGAKEGKFDMGALQDAAATVVEAVRAFITWEGDWQQAVLAADGWEPMGLGRQRCEYNERMAQFETDLLDLEMGGGIPNRTQFKHVVFGPQLWAGRHNGAFFPAIRDLVEAGDWTLANETIYKTAGILRTAAARLLGQ